MDRNFQFNQTFRYYNPAVGRFLIDDPYFRDGPERCLERPIECNFYSYVGNSPTKFIDRFGLKITLTGKVDKNGFLSAKISFSGNVRDFNSGQGFSKEALKRFASEMKNGFKESFNQSGKNFEIEVGTIIITSNPETKPGVHDIIIVQSLGGARGEVKPIGGFRIALEYKLCIGAYEDSSLKMTFPHEIGHAIGLRHKTDPKNTLKIPLDNLMVPGKRNDGKLTFEQLNWIIEHPAKYNQGGG